MAKQVKCINNTHKILRQYISYRTGHMIKQMNEKDIFHDKHNIINNSMTFTSNLHN